MSRLRQSIRRRLRHVDSPPPPSSRDISHRSSPTSVAAAHLPAIPEAPEAAASSRVTLEGSSSAAATVAAGATAAGAATAGATAAALLPPRAAGAGGACFEEVDLQQGGAAPGKHPQQQQ